MVVATATGASEHPQNQVCGPVDTFRHQPTWTQEYIVQNSFIANPQLTCDVVHLVARSPHFAAMC